MLKLELEVHTPPESKTLVLEKGNEINIVGRGQKGAIHNLTTVSCRVKSYSPTKTFPMSSFLKKQGVTVNILTWGKTKMDTTFPTHQMKSWLTKPQNIIEKEQPKTFSSRTVPDKLSPAFLKLRVD